MQRFVDQAVIVTGAARGIGAALARRFAEEGAGLVLADLDQEATGGVAAELRAKYGATVVVTGGDLSTEAAAGAAVEAARSTWGRLDVLVANAGGGVILPTLRHTEETLQATMDRNLWSAIRCTLAALPPMVEAGYGRVVYIGADSVRNGIDAHAIYNAAKGGVHAMARGFAREFATRGVTFNTVAPAATLTPEFQRVQIEHPEVVERAVAVIPMGRPADMEEVAAAVAFLTSREASFITGQVLSVNGGSTMG